MKIFVTLLAVLALAYSAPQPRRLFHEHYEDFLDVIQTESAPALDELAVKYLEFEEFQAGLGYLVSTRFRNLIYEMENLPEFQAVVEFLESHNIDILYFINEVNDAVDSIQGGRRMARQSVSGRDVSSFIQDSIKVFPKDKLSALYDEKVANFEDFRTAMENFQSEEWDQIYEALWQNEVFLTEVQELGANGIDLKIVISELRAVLGTTMKIFVTFLAVLALGYSAPQPRQLFHEHYEEFIDLIQEEALDELYELGAQYLQYDEFQAGIDYIMSPRFGNLVYEMEDIPEFRAMVEFLESHNIDILYFINEINEAVDSIKGSKRMARQSASGRDMSSFIQDSIKLFPKEKLIALYDEKMATSDDFRNAMENFQSEEFDQIWEALWQNEVFLTEVQELGANGIDVKIVIKEFRAILGIFD
ncbi:uncharacterized protein LOC112047215 [Bicyclus anynana]|uniref:Uncharacterized protein LOC112047215 n=1 Tax=Bicyclus anynana TaxID=110368 RepID=A0A6J1N4J4_BICAN|nr:uncharacterized protein LOC112047215 [Bicyclus anynana]